MTNSEKRVLVIAGPTTAGESTITNKLIEQFPKFKRLVTATTRPPRLNEKEKIDYYFFSEEEFKKQIENGNILEHTQLAGTGIYYGTYKKDLDEKLANDYNIIINPDLVGAKFYKEKYNATTIFIDPGGLEEIERRLRSRDSSISDEDVKKRLESAKNELDNEMPHYDYVVMNKRDKLDQAVQDIINILKKEGYNI
ncbi:MAG: guanylate kinase [Candidatus Komeilibacteria bacterium]